MGDRSSPNRHVRERFMLTSELPAELIIDNILSRLSIRVLKRCELVSKSWLATIRSDPRFADLHFSRSSQNPMLILTPSVVTDRRPNFHIIGTARRGSNYPFSSIQLLAMRDIPYSIVNSCQGLICLLSYISWGPIIIMNPVTREKIELPREEEPSFNIGDHNEIIPNKVVVGFGYHPPTNVYKVVRIFKVIVNQGRRLLEGRLHILGTETWRSVVIGIDEIELYDEPNAGRSTETTILVRGTLNWIVIQRSEDNNIKKVKILTFNIEDESFRTTDTPWFFNTVFSGSLGLANLSENLAIYGFEETRFRVSIMDHTTNVWRRSFSIPLVPPKPPVPNLNLINYHFQYCGMIHGSLNKDEVYIVDVGDRFGAYDARNKSWEFVTYFSQDMFSPFCHVESLLSPITIINNAAHRQGVRRVQN